MIRLNTLLAIFVVVFVQVCAGDGDEDRTVWDMDSGTEGGTDDLDIRDPHLKILADVAVEDYNTRSNSRFYQPLVEIVDAKKGRGGAKDDFSIKLLLGKSSCPKNLPKQILRQCAPTSDDQQAIEAMVTEDLDGKVRERIFYNDITVEEAISEKFLHVVGNRLPFAEADSWARFRRFVNAHNRTYKSEEETAHRYQAYKENMREAEVLQSTELGTAVYGETIFSDLSKEEFLRRYANMIPTKSHYVPSRSSNSSVKDGLRMVAMLTFPAKQQGVPGKTSGCCWAFALVAAAEVMSIFKNGYRQAEVLSEQQVADCTSGDCEHGGHAWDAAGEMMTQSGFVAGKDYPSYDAGEHECRSKGIAAKVKIVGRTELPKDEHAMFDTLATPVPIVVAICADPIQNYQEGTVYNPQGHEHCEVNHAVIINAGVLSQIDKYEYGFWGIHNSWGTGWGNAGNAVLKFGVDALKITHRPFTIDIAVL